MTANNSGESMEVIEGIDEEKTVIFDAISLVEAIFKFFLFLENTEDCVVAA